MDFKIQKPTGIQLRYLKTLRFLCEMEDRTAFQLMAEAMISPLNLHGQKRHGTSSAEHVDFADFWRL